jgi:hypothetical protein
MSHLHRYALAHENPLHINPARILNRFGKAGPIQRADGKPELVGGRNYRYCTKTGIISSSGEQMTFHSQAE